MPTKKSDRVFCDVCDKDYAPSRLCGHLNYAAKQWAIKKKRETDIFTALYPSTNPYVRYMEERHRALPDDYDLDEFNRAKDFIDLNMNIVEMLIADIDDQLTYLTFADVLLAWKITRRILIRDRGIVQSESKFFMNDHYCSYLSRLIQIVRPEYFGKWRTRKPPKDSSYNVDFELGWNQSEDQPDQDSAPAVQEELV